MRRLTLGLVLLCSSAVSPAATNAELLAKVSYATEAARRVVADFNIACPQGDGRHIPLQNVMIGWLSQSSRNLDASLRADSRGREVRIYSTLRNRKTGEVLERALWARITEWDELYAENFGMPFVKSQCYYDNSWMVVYPGRKKR